MSDFDCPPPPADDWIDRWVQIDEQLVADNDTGRHESTAAGGDSMEGELADCLGLLDRLRRHTTLWPGESASWQWLYREDLTPQRIGRFEIRRRLGMGGFGTVFHAHDPDLDRDVALKVPRLECIVSQSARQRFLREAKAAACLSHSAIVPIFEVGHIGPISYIAYELCHGQTLEQWLKDHARPLTAQLACQIMQHLAESVQHAHSRGVIHRDLKPSNVILMADSVSAAERTLDVASLRVTDFGLAQVDVSDGDTLTESGAPIGTPAYMSPEQARGEKHITAASDIYSLGVIFYQLITGKLPHQKDNNIGTLLQCCDSVA